MGLTVVENRPGRFLTDPGKLYQLLERCRVEINRPPKPLVPGTQPLILPPVLVKVGAGRGLVFRIMPLDLGEASTGTLEVGDIDSSVLIMVREVADRSSQRIRLNGSESGIGQTFHIGPAPRLGGCQGGGKKKEGEGESGDPGSRASQEAPPILLIPSRKRSASRAAIQPVLAAVTAWR